MKKAILYIRVSTDEQAERGHSLAYQEEKLRLYCQLKGIEVVRLFKEDYSAKTFDRPVIKSMLSFLKSNRNLVDQMLFIKWDRFSRNAGDAYAMIKTLHKLGIEPHATEQPLDLSVPENKTMLALYLTIPEVENDRRALNTISGMRRARREGRFLGIAPRGYKNKRDERNKPILEVDNVQSVFVKKGFEDVAKGLKPVFTILQELRTDGFDCSKSNFWNVLTNPIYYGGVEIPAYKDEKYEIVNGIHQPIISKELFDNVQNILFDKKKQVPTNNVRREEYPLRGNLVCEQCGKLLTGSKAVNRFNTIYFYYHCTKGCNQRFRADELNEKFVNILKELKPKQKFIDAFNKQTNVVNKENEVDRKTSSSKLQGEIKKFEERILNAQKLLIDNVISADEYRGMKTNFETEISKLKRDNVAFTAYDNEIPQYARFSTQLFENLDSMYLSADLETKSRLLGWIFPEKITFPKNGVPTLKLNKTFSLICSLDKGFGDKKNGLFILNNEKSTCVTRPGFEPRLTVPKTAVLPLHHQALTGANIKSI